MAREVFYVKIINNNDFPITDHYAGAEYVMEPGRVCQMPFEAAAHIFGISNPDDLMNEKIVLDYLMRRWGWNRPDIIKENKHKEWFKKIKISIASYAMVEIDHTHDGLAEPRKSPQHQETDSDESESLEKKMAIMMADEPDEPEEEEEEEELPQPSKSVKPPLRRGGAKEAA